VDEVLRCVRRSPHVSLTVLWLGESATQEVTGMALSPAAFKAMIRDYQGLNLSDEEYERVRPEPDRELAAVEKVRELDLDFCSRMSSLEVAKKLVTL
jgi:hypothetical protein